MDTWVQPDLLIGGFTGPLKRVVVEGGGAGLKAVAGAVARRGVAASDDAARIAPNLADDFGRVGVRNAEEVIQGAGALGNQLIANLKNVLDIQENVGRVSFSGISDPKVEGHLDHILGAKYMNPITNSVPQTTSNRRLAQQFVRNHVENSVEIRLGAWRNQSDPVLYYRSGNNLVLTNAKTGKFISYFKDGTGKQLGIRLASYTNS